jgi:hypothetical protein
VALDVSALQADLLAAFTAMNGMENGGNEYHAEKMAEAVKKYILAGEVSTGDSGVAPAGVYAGTGSGVMAIDDSGLKAALQTTFEAAYGDSGLADHMAADIDGACAAEETVDETSSGTVTLPDGKTLPFSGPATGMFAGDAALIAAPLKACFQAMTGMLEGGNAYYAARLADAVDTYMKAGSVTVELKAPFISGQGTGGIA